MKMRCDRELFKKFDFTRNFMKMSYTETITVVQN